MLLLLSPFFERHRVVLNKGTDGCVESTFVIPQDGYVTKYGTECVHNPGFFYHAFSEAEVGFCLWYIEFLAKFLEFFRDLLSFFRYHRVFLDFLAKI